MNPKEKLSILSSKLEGTLFFDSSSEHQATRMAYATDASVYQELPIAVALPKSKKDLVQLIQFASVYGMTLIPRAAGTSLAGQVVGHGIVLDIGKHFNAILELNTREKWVRTQPGVIRDDLNAFLKPHGLMFGPETSTANRAMIGGMIGNNSSGLHSIVWGDTRSNLLECKVLLNDGSEALFKSLNSREYEAKKKLDSREGDIYRKIDRLLQNEANRRAIIENYPKESIKRRNTGYALDLLAQQKDDFNFCKLIAGSEGTLGIITEVKLKLIPLPPEHIGILCLHCNSIEAALSANNIVLQHAPQASELVDKYILDFTKDHPHFQKQRFFIEGDPAAILMVELSANSAAELQAKAEKLKKDLIGKDLIFAYPFVEGSDTAAVWEIRKAGLGLIRNLPGEAQPVNLIEDCAVASEDLPAYIAEIRQLLTEHQLQASFYAHAGAGELHIEPFINLKSAEGRQTFRDVLTQTAQIVKKYQGSLSGEHGDGRLRGEFIPVVLGDEVYALLKEVKSIFDNDGVFNTGKITDAPPMDLSLRYATVQDESIRMTKSKDKSTIQKELLSLAEKCSGSGDCRKSHLSGGTMCPSYMATREEIHTTRARANILRQFLSNPQSAKPFDQQEIMTAMDLCLSCKACKTECPSAVDITKMKAAFLQEYQDLHGIPVRSKLTAGFAKIQKTASKVPGIYNFLIKNQISSSLIKQAIGFSTKRSLPKVAKTSLSTWISKQTNKVSSTISKKKTVYLFCDEFSEYNDVKIGQAAYHLLTGLGYEVKLTPHLESARAHLSKGLIRQAKKIIDHNIRTFYPLINSETPLIGVEPSAILTFRDEYLDLAEESLKSEAKKLAKNTFLIDEFLAAEMEAGHIKKTQFETRNQHIKLHGHCYQKALNLLNATKKILSFPMGYSVEIIPSGCCGMAGSFGYEKEHYQISMNIAELVLLPAVRESDKKTLIAAPGTSCRHQIKDGADRIAFHPVEILWQAFIKN